MKLKQTVTAPIAVLVSYGLYFVCFRTELVSGTLIRYGDYSLVSGIVLVLLTTLMPALIYAKCKGVGYSARMEFLSLRPSRSIFALCALLFALAGTVLIAMGMNALFGGVKYSLVDTYALALSDRELPVALRCIGYAVIPAVAEEVLFRGVLFTEYRENGFAVALIFTSALFALSQFSPVKLPVFFFLGCVMGVLYYVTESLPLTVLCRLAFNLLAFYFEEAAWTLILKRSDFVFFFCFCAVLLLFSAVLALSEAQRIFYVKGIDADPTPPEGKNDTAMVKRFLIALLSPTFLLCVVAAIAILRY